jgi:hypothetical protein
MPHKGHGLTKTAFVAVLVKFLGLAGYNMR